MLDALVWLANQSYDATDWIVGTLYAWSISVVYAVLSFFLGLLGEFLTWVFGDSLSWLPVVEFPELVIQFLEIANNFLPVDAALTYLAAYLAFDRALWVWKITKGLFWAA